MAENFFRRTFEIYQGYNPTAMFKPSLHIARMISLATMIVVLGSVVMTSSALADGSRKTSTRAERATAEKRAAALLKYGTPVYGAMETTLDAMHRKDLAKAKPTGKNVAVARDAESATGASKIVSLRASGDIVTVRVELQREESQLEIGVYNMLGKKVQDVHKGSAARGSHEYTAPVNDLPEGVYICIVQGADFRRAEKFYLSR